MPNASSLQTAFVFPSSYLHSMLIWSGNLENIRMVLDIGKDKDSLGYTPKLLQILDKQHWTHLSKVIDNIHDERINSIFMLFPSL